MIDQGGINMDEIRLGVVEEQFADIIWQNEPLSSGELVRICEEKLKWKKSTTYTVLRKLCDRGIFKNEGGAVASLMSKEEFLAIQSENFVDETFKGSLPAFIAAFSKRKKLSAAEVSEIRRMIDSYGEE